MNIEIKQETLIKKLIDIFGEHNVLSSEEERYVYSFDCSNFLDVNNIANAVVLAEDKDQLIKLVKLSNEFKIPLIPRAAGTNHVGSCVPLFGGIIVSFAKMDKIIEIDEINMIARVEPGLIIKDLQDKVESIGLFFPPDPSNLKISTIGGAIAQNSGGPRGFKYGIIKDYTLDLEVILPDGRVINTSKPCHKNSAGYHLTPLFIGSEGTLGIITQATLKLIPKPQDNNVMLVYFDDLEDASKAVCGIFSHHILPSALELLDQKTLQTIEKFRPSGFLTEFEACLLIEVDGFSNTLDYQCQTIKNICEKFNSKNIIIAKDKQEYDNIWVARRSAYACCTKLDYNVIAEDIVVPRQYIPKVVKEIKSISDKYNLTVCIMGHIGDGNIHPNFALDLQNKAVLDNFYKARQEILDFVISLQGSITGEHGIGFEKSNMIKKMYPKANIEIMNSIKTIIDKNNIMNPGKILIDMDYN